MSFFNVYLFCHRSGFRTKSVGLDTNGKSIFYLYYAFFYVFVTI